MKSKALEYAILKSLSLNREWTLTQEEVDTMSEYCLWANMELQKAVSYLIEGKKKFTPDTTNSLVDDFIKKHQAGE